MNEEEAKANYIEWKQDKKMKALKELSDALKEMGIHINIDTIEEGIKIEIKKNEKAIM